MTWQAALTTLVQQRLGVVLDTPDVLARLQPTLEQRARGVGVVDLETYVQRLATADPQGRAELQWLAQHITVGQTHFFRDLEQIEGIVEFLQQRARAMPRPLQIWSAGCSTGEEPYTLAMACAARNIPVHILGTDINEASLQVAEAGEYGAWSLRDAPLPLRQQYMVPSPGGQRVHEVIRRMVRLRAHNLLDSLLPRPDIPLAGWDCILCRNVFIYFTPAHVQQVLTRMAAALEPQGLIFLGPSELHTPPPCLRTLQVGARTAYEVAVPGVPPAVAPLRAAASRPMTYEAIVHSHLSRDDLAGAEVLLRALVATAPEPTALTTLGNICLQQQRLHEAAALYDRALELAPLWPELHYLQGVLCRKQGDAPGAIKALRRALFLDPQFWPAAFLLAGVFERLGKTALSLREYGNTLAAIDGPRTAPLFRSHALPDTSTELPESDVRRVCQVRLRGPSRS